MGVFNNIRIEAAVRRRATRGQRKPACSVALGLALTMMLTFGLEASLIAADQGKAVAWRTAMQRPVAAVGQRQIPRRTRPRPSPMDRPLTRAATQIRVKKISPVEWLRRYGKVEVGAQSE